MNKEREAFLAQIRSEKDTPHQVSNKSISRWLERMQPQNEEMRAYLVAYFSAPTLKEKQRVKDSKLAALSSEQQKVFLAQWWECIENDMSFQAVAV